jgi:ribonuclease E
MSEPGKSDRWNSVLESLGVPVSQPSTPQPTEKAAEAPAAAKQPVSMLPPKKEKPTPKPKPGPAPAKSPSYWSRIAGALGLEVAAAPEPAAEEPKVEHRGEPVAEPLEEMPREPADQPEPPPQRHTAPRGNRDLPPRAFERPSREERPPREERRHRHERAPREERPRHEAASLAEEPSSALNDMFGAKPRDLDVFSLGENQAPRVREPIARNIDDDERGSVLDYDVPVEGGSDLAIGKNAPSGFEAEAGGDEGGGRRRRRRRGRGRGRRGGAARESAPPAHEADIEPAGEETDFDFERDDELELELEGTELPDVNQERPSNSGRRHRDDDVDRYPPAGERQQRSGSDRGSDNRGDKERGGRGRRPRGGRDRDRERFGVERPARGGDAQRGGAPRSQAAEAMHASQGDFEDDLAGDLDDEAVGQGDLPTHKKIPTWDEAVGMLIEANMATRGNDRDRDRGYGRGRGGRGRG